MRANMNAVEKSLLDDFAGRAMQGMLASSTSYLSPQLQEQLAEDAYNIAMAMCTVSKRMYTRLEMKPYGVPTLQEPTAPKKQPPAGF